MRLYFQFAFTPLFTPSTLALFSLLLLSAFFSASETALLSLSRAQVKRLSKGSAGEQAAFELLRHPQRLLAIVLVGNMFVNVLLASLCANYINRLFLAEGQGWFFRFLQPALERLGLLLSDCGWRRFAGGFGILLNIALLTPILIVFGELTPKTLALQGKQQLSRVSAFPLLYFGKLIAPLLWVLLRLSNLLQRLFGLQSSGKTWSMLTPDEVAASFAASEAGGVSSGNERELLERIMRFGSIEASDIMVPRTEILGVSDNMSLQQAFQKARFSPYEFLPVYHESLDDIWAVIAFADYPLWLHCAENQRQLSEYREQLQSAAQSQAGLPVYAVSFVPPSVRIEQLLADMRRQSKRFTIVVGEYGGTLGIVTISAILEEIIGRHGNSGQRDLLKKLPEKNCYVADGRARLRLIGAQLDLRFDSEADSLGGLVMELLGRVPHKGERLHYGKLQLQVLQMAGNRVGKVRLELPDSEQDKQEEQSSC
ncbi:MAG: HlyC/CorC family transporter [Lentisphaerae bacterium]|nr:HlyC/CorC family transporter [Lentisphaerota bacterium]